MLNTGGEAVDLEGFALSDRSGEPRRVAMTHQQLRKLAASANKGKPIENGKKDVEVFDCLDQTALIKLVGAWGIDYMHLAKYDGEWQIAQVIWQSPPRDRGEFLR